MSRGQDESFFSVPTSDRSLSSSNACRPHSRSRWAICSCAFAARGQQGLALFNVAIEAVKTGLAQGIHNVFLMILVLMIAGLIAVFFLKEVPLLGGRSRSVTLTDAEEDATPEGNLAAMI
jgi:hypothetical protein